MPKVGETKLGREIGRSDKTARFVWHTCEDCGKERWVILERGKPAFSLCNKCANKLYGLTHRGSNHPQWKGGRYLNKEAKYQYVYITLTEDDPYYCMADPQCHQVLEHRYVMAQHLGRPLESWEIVDHRNDPKSDNRIENLDLVTLHENLQLQKMRNRLDLLEKENKELRERVLQLEVNSVLRESDISLL